MVINNGLYSFHALILGNVFNFKTIFKREKATHASKCPDQTRRCSYAAIQCAVLYQELPPPVERSCTAAASFSPPGCPTWVASKARDFATHSIKRKLVWKGTDHLVAQFFMFFFCSIFTLLLLIHQFYHIVQVSGLFLASVFKVLLLLTLSLSNLIFPSGSYSYVKLSCSIILFFSLSFISFCYSLYNFINPLRAGALCVFFFHCSVSASWKLLGDAK